MDLKSLRRAARRGISFVRDIGLKKWRDGAWVSRSAPIVVGGCGRSGTTLMRVILDTHVGIACGPESHLFESRWPDIARLHERFEIPVEEIRRMFRESGSQAEFIDVFFEAWKGNVGKPRWAEKTPRNVLNLDFLFEHFPNARFIHMVRDGRDTICSLRTHPRHKTVNGKLIKLDTDNPIEECIARWSNDVRAGLRWAEDGRTMIVRYEDLVTRPAEILPGVFAFLDEAYDDSLLEFHKSERDATHFPQNPEATSSIYTRAVCRWKQDLSPQEIDLFRREAGDLLIRLGYEPNEDWIRDAVPAASA